MARERGAVGRLVGAFGAVIHWLDWWLDNPAAMDRESLINTLSRFRRFGVEGVAPPPP